MTAMKLLF